MRPFHPHPNLPPSRGKGVQDLALNRKRNFASEREVSTIPEGNTNLYKYPKMCLTKTIGKHRI
jgi:hypothetical protein